MAQCKIHLLDVGPQEYGDAVLCQFGGRTVLIDGAHPGDDRGAEGHPSIPDQLVDLLGQQPPYRLDLLIVSHAHQDHIGCLPKLVADDVVRFDWALVTDPDLGWGRAQDEDRDAEITDDRVRQLVAALRDECAPLHPRTDDARVARFIEDAVSLEDRYRQMLETLRQRGTRVVRLGRDSVSPLEKALAGIGLRVLGPSQEQLLRCADLINGLSRDAIGHATDLFAQDAALTPVELYRRVAAGVLDALDVSRPGPAVNLQSIVTVFKFQGRRFLFAGDMQFVDPQVDDADVVREIGALRRRVKDVAPYGFAKLSHHGSNNAFSEEILSELGGTALFGICAGEGSTRHPNPATLRVLYKHRKTIRWARTDHNGRVAITFGTGSPRVDLTQGRINDERPNSTDVSVATGVVAAPAPGVVTRVEPAAIGRAAPGSAEVVEVRALIPHVDTRVTIVVEVTPPARRSPVARGGTPAALGAGPADAIRLAGGRPLPRLLFATSGAALAANIGREEAAAALDAIRVAGMPLCDDLPVGLSESAVAADHIRRSLRQHADLAGVVLIGGHDVIPHQRLDCLPADVRAGLPENEDPDGFIVWNDEVYGDVDGDGLPELPVSRIPDGKSAELVFNALQASVPERRERAGIRNVARPFAGPLFETIAGTRAMLVSKPAVFDQSPPLALDADQLYFMLHGDYVDAARFWGEGTPSHREALNLGNLPREIRGVVFTGCCWGALTTDTPAGLVAPGRPFGLKTPASSIALAALARRAVAFVGCTGAHYSPTEAPYDYFGGPMHRAFWRHHAAGLPPARALFSAKIDYLAGMPHGRGSDVQVAIEFKILRQYTCLGLGW